MNRPARNPQGPKVRLGDFIRTTRELCWLIPAGEMRIPAGTAGEVFPWETPDWGRCCAVKFDGFEHPLYRYFPHTMLRPGVDGWPDSVELLGRKEERRAA